jgi:outer membrane lipoprotein SlyB
MRRNQILIALLVLLGIAVIVLAATLMNNRLEARAAAAGALASEPSLAAAPTIAPFNNHADGSNHSGSAPASDQSMSITPSNNPFPMPSFQVTSVCNICGTVESVSSVQRQGKINGIAVGDTTVGLGAVAGGILGGLLGNQIGGGSGNTAATVLGVAGGAYAGDSAEKNMKKITVYLIRVRMDDGSMRDMEISTTVPVGAKVLVEGRNLRLADTAG